MMYINSCDVPLALLTKFAHYWKPCWITGSGSAPFQPGFRKLTCRFNPMRDYSSWYLIPSDTCLVLSYSLFYVSHALQERWFQHVDATLALVHTVLCRSPRHHDKGGLGSKAPVAPWAQLYRSPSNTMRSANCSIPKNGLAAASPPQWSCIQTVELTMTWAETNCIKLDPLTNQTASLWIVETKWN